jgi:hypothetical protein
MLLGRHSEAYGWRKGLAGERKVGAELERLVRKDWRVLHSIPLPRDVDIDHLLIGTGGVSASTPSTTAAPASGWATIP